MSKAITTICFAILLCCCCSGYFAFYSLFCLFQPDLYTTKLSYCIHKNACTLHTPRSKTILTSSSQFLECGKLKKMYASACEWHGQQFALDRIAPFRNRFRKHSVWNFTNKNILCSSFVCIPLLWMCGTQVDVEVRWPKTLCNLQKKIIRNILEEAPACAIIATHLQAHARTHYKRPCDKITLKYHNNNK